jgi:rhodanese-related sulfurtransferase
MTQLSPLTPAEVQDRLQAGHITLVDIREADEFAREHIEGAINMPFSDLEKGRLKISSDRDVVFHCRSGMRTQADCQALARHAGKAASVLGNGLEAWKRSCLPVATNRKAPLEISRQVQLAAGALVLLGATFALTINPAFMALSAFVGAGLMFAGLSGWCGLGILMSRAPWNRPAAR